ncbi:MAG TPA: hypothetical protein VK509_19205, partial [Polyangiales bacterium]|nr:hypothetical protein [Polyangiales bacterium]
PAALHVTLEAVSEQLGRASFDRRYRGRYLGRSVVIDSKTVPELYADAQDPTRSPIALDAVYPESLADELERYRALEEEHATLVALQDGVLTAPGGVIRHSGREIRRRDLPGVIAEVDGRRLQARERILAHDRACRSAHRAAARRLGQGWEEHYAGLLALLHYADHGEANLRDAAGHLRHVLAIVTADGNVSSSEMQRLVKSAADLHVTLWEVMQQKSTVVLPEQIARRLEVASWLEMLPKETLLDSPTAQNMSAWLNIIDSWVAAVRDALDALGTTTLELMLEAETYMADCLRLGRDPGPAPAAARIPNKYTTLVPGTERPRQKRLDLWDRFQTADGFVPATLRFVVAGAILGTALAFGSTATDASVEVYNGLGIPVKIAIDGVRASVAPFAHAQLSVTPGDRLHVETRSADGDALIEAFDADAHNNRDQYVYNVAAASPLIEWTAVYGPRAEKPPRMLGAPRWLSSRAEVLFEVPPKSVSTRGGGGASRTVLDGFGKESPEMQLSMLEGKNTAELISAHARWEPLERETTYEWLWTARQLPGFQKILAARLQATPHDMVLLRFEQDSTESDSAAHAAVCARHRQLSERDPRNVDLLYLANRCNQDREQRASKTLELAAAHPNHGWLAMAAAYGHAGRGQWPEAQSALERAVGKLPAIANGLIVDLARIRRMAAPSPDAAALDDIARRSSDLRALLAFEPGAAAGEDGPSAFSLLANGEIDRALEIASKTKGPLLPIVLRLAAASDGASDAVVARARELPDDAGLQNATVWISLALAAREGRDPTALVARAREQAGDNAEVMLAWADAKQLRENRERLERELRELSPSERGAARLMGVLLLGPDAPEPWWNEVRALLFRNERPFLQRLDAPAAQ